MVARVYTSRREIVDERRFSLDVSGNALGEVLDWFNEGYSGASEFGDCYECLVTDEEGEIVADFHT